MTRRLISLLVVFALGGLISERYANHLDAKFEADRQAAILEGRARLAEMAKPHFERLGMDGSLSGGWTVADPPYFEPLEP